MNSARNGELLKAAIGYLEAGYSIIPVGNDKKPLIKWEKYQKEKATKKEVMEWWLKYPEANIGLVTGSISNIVAIDVDDPDLHNPLIDGIVEMADPPESCTPRGGRHILFACPDQEIRNTTSFLPKVDFRGEGGYILVPPSMNGGQRPYHWKRDLLTTDTTRLPSSLIDIITSKRDIINNNILNNNIINKEGDVENPVESDTTNYFTGNKILHEGSRDDDLFRIGMSMADGRLRHTDIIQVLHILARNCVPAFPEKEVREKVKSIFARLSRKDRNLSEEVREWCLLQKGYFNTTSILHELQITTKNEVKNLTVIINRLQKDGIIEKVGEKRGVYRTKEINVNEMRFIEEDIPEFDVVLPFGLNRVVGVYPKNIIIIAGTKSSGKTSLCLQVAKDNQDRHEVVYLNSEMGDEEWSVRLKNMGIKKKSDMRFKAYGVNKNFHDHMDKGRKIYIVDYLEIHENFFEVAKPIRLIHEAIQDGICIIALQKASGAAYARGGEFSMEKSRLYLSLDYLKDDKCSRITIMDAKSPKIPDNVRGYTKRVKIRGGCEFIELDYSWVM